MEEINLPKADTIGEFAFNGCSGLKKASLPKATTLGDESAFLGCASLEEIELFSLEALSPWTFNGCTSLEAVNFGNEISSIVTLENVNAFNDVPKSCKIVVPDDLYSEVQ